MNSEAASASAGKLKYLIITAFVMALDQFTKYIVSTRLREREIDVIPNLFAVSYTENPGIAFGMLNARAPPTACCCGRSRCWPPASAAT